MNETQVHLRLTEQMRREIEDYAAAYATSVSAAIRILIRKGLAAEKERQS